MRKRTNKIDIRLDDKEFEILNEKVTKSGLSREGFIRKVLNGFQINERPPVEFFETMHLLRSLQTELRKVSWQAYQLKIIDYDAHLARYRIIEHAISNLLQNFLGYGSDYMFDRNAGIIKVPLEKLCRNAHNPFSVREDKYMDKLVKSIRRVGLIEPIIVRKKSDGNFEIISGNRRAKAFELLGKKTIDAILINASDDEADTILLDCNLTQRECDEFDK